MTDTVFVSMPFGDDPENPNNEWTKLYEHGLKALEKPLSGLPAGSRQVPVTLRRADHDLVNLVLKENVISNIEEAAFVICVLTTSVIDGTHGLRLTRPNVLWELGYAEAVGKPVVILADNESLRSLPILAGVPNVCIYNHGLVKTTTAKEAPGVLHIIARDLVPWVTQASEDAKRGVHRTGRSRAIVYTNRDDAGLDKLIATATKQVDILTTNLDYFLSGKMKVTPHPFERALSNGATVRIVTMDPESIIAEYRAKQLVRSQDIPGYRKELRDRIIWFFERFGDHPQFRLNLYNDFPLQITTRVDENIITSIVTRGERARRRIQVRFHLNDEGVTESFVSHFQSMFDTSTDITGMKWVLRHPDTRQTSELDSETA